jgi:hypothetical protein
LQEVRDYEACVRLGEAIAPGMYHVAICSAFKEPFQRGLGKQQVAILAKYQAKAAWAEPWKSIIYLTSLQRRLFSALAATDFD